MKVFKRPGKMKTIKRFFEGMLYCAVTNALPFIIGMLFGGIAFK